MSEQRVGRWIIKWESGDGAPYYTGKDDPWRSRRRDAKRFRTLTAARIYTLGSGGQAKVYRLVRRAPS